MPQLPLRYLIVGTIAAALLATTSRAKTELRVPAVSDAQTLLDFINELAHSDDSPESCEDANAHCRSVAEAQAEAADRILTGEATDEQKIAALAAMVSAHEMLHGLGDAEAMGRIDSLLEGFRKSKKPRLAFAALQLRVQTQARRWRSLGRADKSRLLEEIDETFQATPPTIDHARLLTSVADVLGEGQQREPIVELVQRLRPRLAESGDPSMSEKLAALDGVVRRLQLPGSMIEVEGKLLSGEAINWEAYRGKVVLIDYWATWCGLCLAEMPNVRRLHDEYADEGFEVLGVSLDDDAERVAKFLEDRQIPWQTLVGHDQQTRGWNHPMVGKYGIYDLPRAILVDRDGRVVHMNARGEQLATELRRLFDQPVAVEHAGPADELVKTASFDASGDR